MTAKNQRAIVSIVTNDHFHQAMVLWRSIEKFEKESDFILFVVGYDAADPDYQRAGFTVLDARALTRIFHGSHSEAKGKADETRRRQDCDQGCMSPYRSDQNSTTTQYSSALAKLQTERHEISGLNPKNWDQFFFQYHPLEVCCALKPQALLYLLKSYEKVIYLDTDMQLFGPLERGWEALEEADLSLTPHGYTPIPPSGLQPSRFLLKMLGIFNAGYVGASRGSTAFLEWWWQQTEYNCVTLIYMGVFLDQFYLNYAVTLVSRLHVMEDATYNVASWNYHERKLEKVGSEYLVDQKPLTCFHFSGWMKNPTFDVLKILDARSAELFYELYCDYQKLLLAEQQKLSEKNYPYAKFQDGEKIDQAWREWMRRDIPELQNVSNPFLLTREQREPIEETMMMRPRDFRPNLDREIVLSPAIPYECIYITTALSLSA